MDRALAGQAQAEADARTEQALTRLRDIRKEIEALATPEEKIAAIRDRLAETVTQLEALRNADGSNAAAVDDAVAAAEELARRRIEAIEKPIRDAAEREATRTKEVIDELARSVETFGNSRVQAVDQAIARLGDGATPEQRAEVARLAGALYDLQAAEKGADAAGRDLQKTQSEGRQVFEATRTASEKYAAEIEKLNALLQAGAIDQETYARAAAEAAEVLRHAQTDPLSGAIRALDDYAKSAADIAKSIENAIASAFSGAEEAVANFVKTGKLDISDLVTSIIADLARLAVRQSILGPLASALSSVLTSGFGSIFAPASGSSTTRAVSLHGGGVAGGGGEPVNVPLALFARAPRFHEGSPVLRPDEVPAILQTGERVLSRREVTERERVAAPVVFNVYTQDARSFMASRTQIAAELSRMVEAGWRGR
jgi:lambda family phage tail tape measure protein